MQRDPAVKALFDALAAPFEPSVIKWKPGKVSNNRCLALAFIDARIVQDRLDEVLGGENWQDNYTVLPDGSVICRLTVILGDRMITKEDVGSLSEQPDAGDRLKSAFSDGLKRAAIKFGIGRFLYRLPPTWVDFDPVKKQIIKPPELPSWARPKGNAPSVPAKPQQPQPPVQDAVRMALADWGKKMAMVGSAQDMTDLLPVFKTIKGEAIRNAVWEYIEEQANDRGYYYDEKMNLFAESHETGEPIAF